MNRDIFDLILRRMAGEQKASGIKPSEVVLSPDEAAEVAAAILFCHDGSMGVTDSMKAQMRRWAVGNFEKINDGNILTLFELPVRIQE